LADWLRNNSAVVDFGVRFNDNRQMTTTVDKTGSVPLPAEVLRESNVHPGDQLDICAEDGNIILRKVTGEAAESLLEILRSLKGLPVSERNHSSVRDLEL